jgi:hypothetical protein
MGIAKLVPAANANWLTIDPAFEERTSPASAKTVGFTVGVENISSLTPKGETMGINRPLMICAVVVREVGESGVAFADRHRRPGEPAIEVGAFAAPLIGVKICAADHHGSNRRLWRVVVLVAAGDGNRSQQAKHKKRCTISRKAKFLERRQVRRSFVMPSLGCCSAGIRLLKFADTPNARGSKAHLVSKDRGHLIFAP